VMHFLRLYKIETVDDLKSFDAVSFVRNAKESGFFRKVFDFCVNAVRCEDFFVLYFLMFFFSTL
jgi:hypothetical protein